MSKKDTTEKQLVKPNFVPDYENNSKRIYANYITISHTGLDFTLSFLDVPAPSKEQVDLVVKGKDVPVPLQCQIVVPNDVIPGLINALQEQLDKHNEKS